MKAEFTGASMRWIVLKSAIETALNRTYTDRGEIEMSDNMSKWTYKTDLYLIVDSYLGEFADNYDIDAVVEYIMREYADNPDVITDDELLSFDLADVIEMFAK